MTNIANIELKAGQVAAVLDVDQKLIQNAVESGYVRPSVSGGQGRGSTRLYSFADIVRLRLFNILVEAYGLERGRAARLLAGVLDERQLRRRQTLVLKLPVNRSNAGIKLEPITLPLKEIVRVTERRVNDVLATYTEGKRGRPTGWSKRMNEAFADASSFLQDADDEQIARAVAEHRAARRSRRRSPAAKRTGASGKR